MARRSSSNTTPTVAVLLLVVLLSASSLPLGTAAAPISSCNDLFNSLLSCIGYITFGGKASAACCSGIRSVLTAASTPEDLRTVCSCIKKVAAKATEPYVSRAAALPGMCSVAFPYKISPSIDCSLIN